MSTVYRCRTCGSPEVWKTGADVHMNTGELMCFDKWFCDQCAEVIDDLTIAEERTFADEAIPAIAARFVVPVGRVCQYGDGFTIYVTDDEARQLIELLELEAHHREE